MTKYQNFSIPVLQQMLSDEQDKFDKPEYRKQITAIARRCEDMRLAIRRKQGQRQAIKRIIG